MPRAGDRAAPAYTSSSPWGQGLLLWAGKEESKEPGASQAWGWVGPHLLKEPGQEGALCWLPSWWQG